MPARAALLALLLFAAPAAAQKPRPVVVAQAAPLGQLVADLKGMARAAAAPADVDVAVKEVAWLVEQVFGEKGYDGIDPNRPLAAYLTLREPFADSSLVLVVPHAGPEKFLDLIDRTGARATPVAGKKDLFTFDLPVDIFEKQSYLRFAGGWAYIALNSDEVADPANLIPTSELFDPKETAQVAVRLFPDRVPAEWLGSVLDDVAELGKGLRALLDSPDERVRKVTDALFLEVPEWLRRAAAGVRSDAKEGVVRYAFDRTTADVTAELAVTPTPGSPLAKDLAARTPSANRFAGMVPADAAAGVVGQWPLFAPEVWSLSDALLGLLGQEAAEEAPDGGRKSVEELFRAVGRGMKAGDGDFAAAVCGPNRGGQFTVVLGLSLADPAGTEKELRAWAKGMGFLKLLAFDVAKVEGVSIHRATIPLLGQEDATTRLFGRALSICFALTPKAIHLAFGPDALDRVKAAVASKPGPAAGLSVVGNASRLAKLVAVVGGEKVGKNFVAVMGTEDKLLPWLSLTLTGGSELRLWLTGNVARVPRLLINLEDIGGP